MAAITTPLLAREALNQFAKRGNWASENVGVMVVFCIVGVVAIGIAWLFIHKALAKRKAAKPTF